MKKVIAILTLFPFLINITSCFSYKALTTQEEYTKFSGIEGIDVLYVQTKQNKIIEFNKKYPGKISEERVIGLPQLKVKYGGEDSMMFYKKKVESIWKNGINYKLITQDTLGYICHESDTINIPLSNIHQLRFKKYESGKTILLLLGTAGSTTVIFSLLIVNQAFNNFFNQY